MANPATSSSATRNWTRLPPLPEIADMLGIDYEGPREADNSDESDVPEPEEALDLQGPYVIEELDVI